MRQFRGIPLLRIHLSPNRTRCAVADFAVLTFTGGNLWRSILDGYSPLARRDTMCRKR